MQNFLVNDDGHHLAYFLAIFLIVSALVSLGLSSKRLILHQ